MAKRSVDSAEIQRIRADKNEARRLFEQFYPNDPDGTDKTRRAILELLAHTIETAHRQEEMSEQRYWRWSVTLIVDDPRELLRLNLSNPVSKIAWMEALKLCKAVVDCFLSCPPSDEAIQSIRSFKHGDVKPIEHGSLLPAGHGYRASLPIGAIPRLYPLVAPLHADMIEYYAHGQEMQKGGIGAHSPGVLEYLDEELAPRVMPRPDMGRHDESYSPEGGGKRADDALDVGQLSLWQESPSIRETITSQPDDEIGQPAGQSLAPDEVQEALDAAEERAGKLPPGQGRHVDPIVRRVIEQYAMAKAEEYYRAEGWQVDPSVATSESYDLRCTRDGVELHVEIKGTQSEGRHIILTYNEVDHACNYPLVELFIVAQVALDESGQPYGGEIHGPWRPWQIDKGQLKAISYVYTVPPL